MDEKGGAEMVHSLVTDVLRELGVSDEKLASLDQAILLRDGDYVGRRFDCEMIRVVWVVEEQMLEFYHEDGQLLRTIDLTDRNRPMVA
jgi:hypothetical protein